MSSVLQRLAKAASASLVQQALAVGIQLASVPILLSAWGVSTYGAWLMLAAIPTYLSLSDFGFGTAASNQMAMRFARGDLAGASRSFHSAILLALTSAVVCGALALLAASLLPLETFLGGQISADDARVILSALSISTLLGMIRAVFYSVLYADGRYPLGLILLAAARAVEFAALATTALAGGGPAACALVTLLTSLLLTLAYGLFVRLTSPWLTSSKVGVSWKELWELAGPSLSFLLFPASNALNNQGVLLAVGASSSPQAVVLFSTLRTASRLAIMPIRTLLESVRPEISRSFGLNQLERLRQMLHLLTWMATWLSLAIAASLCLVAEPLVHAWTAGKVQLDWPTFLFLMAASAVQATAYPSYIVLNGSNNHRELAASHLVVNSLAVAACLLTPAEYTPAPATILLAAELVIAAIALHRAGALLGASPLMTLRAAFLPRRDDLALSHVAIARLAQFWRR
jgi:Membrane protein involved in the export of O-antigen and teichoic acid